jgi:hypothetical protein
LERKKRKKETGMKMNHLASSPFSPPISSIYDFIFIKRKTVHAKKKSCLMSFIERESKKEIDAPWEKSKKKGITVINVSLPHFSGAWRDLAWRESQGGCVEWGRDKKRLGECRHDSRRQPPEE